MLLLIASQTFLRFWLGKLKIKVFLARTSVVNEPGKFGETIAVVYELTKKKLRRNCSPIGHNNTRHFLCPIRRRHLLEFLEIVR